MERVYRSFINKFLTNQSIHNKKLLPLELKNKKFSVRKRQINQVVDKLLLCLEYKMRKQVKKKKKLKKMWAF